MISRDGRIVLLCGGAVALALWLPCQLTAQWPLNDALSPRLVGLMAAFVPYLWMVHQRRRLVGRLTSVLAVAVVARVALLPVAPTFSDDVYRYSWDGRVVRAGLDPYAHPPTGEALQELRDEAVWPHINNPHLRTIYPPVAQLAFAGFGLLGDGVLPMKLLAVMFDLATAWLLVWMLRRRGRAPAEVALYAWNPLVIAETAMSGHMDPLAWFWLLAAVALLASKARLWQCAAGAALALSAGAKLLAGAVWPFLARRSTAAAWVFPLVLFAVVAPFVVRSGAGMFEGLDTYGRKWAGNAGAFVVIEAAIEVASRPLEPLQWKRDQAASFGARAVVVVVFLGLMAWLWLKRAGPEEAAFAAVAAFVVLSPTVHPWYVAWLAPFIALGRPRAWLLLTVLAPLSYFGIAAWSSAAIWVPFAGLFAWDHLRERRVATP